MNNDLNVNYTLGLDIGVTSIGWALLDFDAQKIIKIGVRKFEEPRVPKTGDSLTAERRKNRSARRTIRRRSFRQKQLLQELVRNGLITQAQEQAINQNTATPQNIFFIAKGQPNISPWQLRAEGLVRPLEHIEWARVLLHLCKHRGYQSNAIEKKSADNGAKKDKEKRAMLDGIAQMKTNFDDFAASNPNRPHTIGEMLYSQFCNNEKIRNEPNQYNRTVGREEILQELEILFECQRKFNNPYTQQDFQDKVKTILNYRRHFSKGPGGDSPYGGNLIERMVGKCTLDDSQQRAPKQCYTSVMFRLYQTLNNIRVGNLSIQNTCLTQEEKHLIVQKAQSASKLTYEQIKKILNWEDDIYFKGLNYHLDYKAIMRIIFKSSPDFYKDSIKGKKDIIPRISAIINWENQMSEKDKIAQLHDELQIPEKLAKKLIQSEKNPEKKTLFDFSDIRKMEKILAKHQHPCTTDMLDDIMTYLTLYKEDEAARELEKFGLNKELSEELACKSFSRFGHLGIATMKKLIPHLAAGLDYSQACAAEGFDHAQSQIDRNHITNPTVFRAFKQTQKVIHALIRKYGYPNQICLEVARDLSNSQQEKTRLQKEMDDNESLRKQQEKHFIQEVGRAPRGREAQVWRFYKEQNGQCLYCGNTLGDLNHIFSKPGAPSAEIEHTLPYSRSFDNRQCNKTVACTQCNRQKGNQTPFEFLGHNESSDQWRKFKQRCSQIQNKKKRDILLTTELDDQGYSERMINDTRYITRIIQNWIEKDETFSGRFIATPRKGSKRNVYTVKGSATSFIRKIWQVERFKYNEDKQRETEKNHALDAAVVAAATNRQVKLISDANRKNELDKLEESLKNETRGSKKIQMVIPPPWETFTKELLALYGFQDGKTGYNNDPNQTMLEIQGVAQKYGIDENHRPLEPLFISWMPQRSVKGAIHNDTIYQARNITDPDHEQSKEIYLKRIPVTALTNKNIEDMAGAYDSRTGQPTPMYIALKKRLTAHNGKGKEAFKDPIYKGTGPNAPQIKSVRIRENLGGAMHIQDGAAKNGKMIRVDVFRRKNRKGVFQYFLVPIYTKHRNYGCLPMKAIEASKSEEDWTEMMDEEFYCSLYSNDYMRVERTDGTVDEGYYVSTHRLTASITLHPHDSRDIMRISVKTNVRKFIKYDIGILGERYPVHLPQKRVSLTQPGQNG